MNIKTLRIINRSSTNKERGFGMVEAMISVSLLGVLLVPTMPMITNMTEATQAEYKASQGIDQGEVMDEVKAAQNSAQGFHEAFPDMPVTKENMEAHGFMPTTGSDLRWDVGQGKKFTDNASNQVCAFGWSTTRQAKTFTAETPAVYGVNGGDGSLYTAGCSHSDFKRVATMAGA